MSVIEQQAKPKFSEIANKYLKIYNTDMDWIPYIDDLKANLLKRLTVENTVEELKKRLACTILLPYYEKNTIQDPPQNLLYYCHKWSQYPTRNWLEDFEKVQAKDYEIESIKNECLDMGIIFPPEYNPNTRQAFNWLYEHAEASGDVTDANKEVVVKRLKALVYAYGGVVVCSVFQKPEYEYKIKKLCNWRSGYFFEHLIHEAYKGDEVIKIKNQELTKIRSVDPKLIKKIRTKEE